MISDNYVTGDNIYLRELQNFFFEVLGMMSVTHYGAIGDGRTDCYGPLQVAIDDAKRRKLDYIYVPMGRYIYTGELINMDGITFIGNPHAKIINIRTCEEIPIKQFGASNVDIDIELLNQVSEGDLTELIYDGEYINLSNVQVGDVLDTTPIEGENTAYYIGRTFPGERFDLIGDFDLATLDYETKIVLSKYSGTAPDFVNRIGYTITNEGAREKIFVVSFKNTNQYTPSLVKRYNFVLRSGDTMTGSLAIGSNSTASGDLSFAQGDGNTASGKHSHAQGWHCTASGMYSMAGGTLATASGFDSFAFGNYVVEPNEYIGDTRGNQATGNTSIALGTNTIASGLGAISTGYKTTASGEDSFTQGNRTTASGTNSHAEGYQTTASGQHSHAEGYNSTASGGWSHAEGYNSTASGSHSHAEGSQTIASGFYGCHAEGSSTRATKQGAHAEGHQSEANGKNSHAEGQYCFAQGENQHVQGRFNISQGTAESAVSTDYAHILGNGVDGNSLSNAHTITWGGEAWFAGDVYVGSTSGTNKDAGSKKLATEEYVNTHGGGGGSKAIIMGQLNENYEPTGDVNYDIPVVLAESSGSGLSISNNKVTIGAGISKVKISTTVSVYADIAGTTSLSLKQGNIEVAKVTKGLEANERDELAITNFILSVSENDTICACVKVANGDVVYGVNGIRAQTWITVEEI